MKFLLEGIYDTVSHIQRDSDFVALYQLNTTVNKFSVIRTHDGLAYHKSVHFHSATR
jgi:hypothetical protein